MGLSYTVYVGPYAEVLNTGTGPSRGDFSERIKDALYYHNGPGDTFLWFPNVRRNPPRVMSFDPKEGECFEVIDPGCVKNEPKWFARAFAAELAALCKAYGAENVAIRWGVCSMIS